MNNMEKYFNGIVAIIATFFTYLFGSWDLALQVLIVFMVLDYVTGVLYAFISNQLNSEVGFKGLVKKLMILVVLIIGVMLDRILGTGNWVFRTLVCYFYIANEGISLLENVANIGIPIPNKIRNALEQLNKDDDKDGMWGWGSVITEIFNSKKVSVENCAMAGRSARTFLDEGRWDKVYDALKPGDFVLIQFGHNDGGDINIGKARGELHGSGDESKVFLMEKTGKYQVVYTFGWYLRKFIRDAQEKGAIPIVLSHTPRNKWKDGQIERNSKSYGKWTREAAEATGACFIDLNKISADKLQKMGPKKSAVFYNTDHTHTSLKGARMNAQSIAEGLKVTDCPLKKYLK